MLSSRSRSIISLCPFLVASLPTGNGPTVTIDSGEVVGLSTHVPSAASAIDKFLGIPFADPPVRWSPPQAVTPWTSPLLATSYGPACIQQFNYPEAARNRTMGFFNTPAPGESEDCLTLNVYAPSPSSKGYGWHDWTDAEPSREGKAVMFWIYGGSLRFGTGSMPQYDGTLLAAFHDVILVTMNYRTNIFGYPGADVLPSGEQNLGHLDQRFALDWVQRNIAAFGGDPDKVTIFGESAGALSVDALITQPPVPTPFRAAILQSGTASVRTVLPDYSLSWNNASKTLGCSPSDLACMRAIPATEIKSLIEHSGLAFVPVPDNVTFATYPRLQRRTSTPDDPKFARVPILIGSNAEEGRLYSIGVTSLSAYINTSFAAAPPALVSKLNEVYSATSPNPIFSVANLVTDYTFQCPAAVVARETQNAGVNAYRYYWNASFPNFQPFPDAGVYHASEIPSVFGTYPEQGLTEWQKEVTKDMMTMWTDFAKDPEGMPAKVGWGVVPEMAVLGGGARAENGPNEKGDGMVVKMGTVSDVDERCVEVWDPVFDAMNGGD